MMLMMLADAASETLQTVMIFYQFRSAFAAKALNKELQALRDRKKVMKSRLNVHWDQMSEYEFHTRFGKFDNDFDGSIKKFLTPKISHLFLFLPFFTHSHSILSIRNN